MAVGDPARNPSAELDLIWELLLVCFRDWCQDQAARLTMGPADYDQYTHLTSNLFSGVTPYVEFQPQMAVLLQNYRDVKVYWDVFHHWCMGTLQLVDCPLAFYPVRLCVQLNIIPDFVCERLLGDTALPNRASEWSREQALQQAIQHAIQHLEQQADDSALQAEDGELKSEDSEPKSEDGEPKSEDGELKPEDSKPNSEDSERTLTDSDVCSGYNLD